MLENFRANVLKGEYSIFTCNYVPCLNEVLLYTYASFG